MVISMKVCSTCKQEKTLGDFTPDKRKKLGVTPACKVCRSHKQQMLRKGTLERKKRPRHSDGVTKECSKCWQIKTVDNFTNNKISPDSLSAWCKQCTNDRTKIWSKENKLHCRDATYSRKLKREYGLSIKDYDDLLTKQGGVCAICGTKNGNANGIRLSVDHNHITNEIRGLLCSSCNTALGLFKDSVHGLNAAIHYLGGN
jgi:hypothetical protein